MWLIVILNIGMFIGGLTSRRLGGIIASIVFVPIFAVIQILFLRILCEMVVVILLLPYYLKGSNSNSSNNVTVIEEDSGNGENLDVSVHRNLHTGLPSNV